MQEDCLERLSSNALLYWYQYCKFYLMVYWDTVHRLLTHQGWKELDWPEQHQYQFPYYQHHW